MRIVAVSGGGSGSGKTELIEALLRALPGWGALKTSPAPGEPPSKDYELVLDPKRLMSSGTDTRRYLDAGAGRVAWLIARAPLPAAAVEEVSAAFAGCPGLLVEGGSLAEPLAPGRRYVVVRAGMEAIKPAGLRAIERADAVVVNVPAGAPEGAAARSLGAAPGKRSFLLDARRAGDPGLIRLAEEIRAWARC